MVEWAVAIPFLIIVLLAIFDFARYQTGEYIAQKGALDGLHLATRVDGLGFDVRDADPTSESFRRYLQGRKQAIEVASSLPLSSWFSTDADSTTRLHRVLLETGEAVRAVVLRPGERYRLIRDNGEEEILEHPTLCAPDPPDPSKCPETIDPAADYEDVLLNHPIAVAVYGVVEPILPLIPPLEVKGYALGYREQVRHGLYPDKPRRPGETPTTTTTTTVPECTPPAVYCREGDVDSLRTRCTEHPDGSPTGCNFAQTPPSCCECRRPRGRLGGTVVCPSLE